MKAESLNNINNSWTLFLDRDGVINIEKENDYILNVTEFQFIDKAPEAISRLSQLVGRTIVVTNQKGIGKGLMTEADLEEIHAFLIDEVEKIGGKIDKIYHCSSVDSDSPCRKPNSGMALSAKNDFPNIDFSKSIMIGNTMSDMRFGRELGMLTVFIFSSKPATSLPHPDIDLVSHSLYEFAKTL